MKHMVNSQSQESNQRHECLKCGHNKVCRYQEAFEAVKEDLKAKVDLSQGPFQVEAICQFFKSKQETFFRGEGTAKRGIDEPDKRWAVDEHGDIGLSTGADYLDKKEEEEEEVTNEGKE